MNADRLLAHYERIADAPDAIARLRRFILDLAVRGKLVPQDPNDDPASELLERIAAEKAKISRRPKDLPEIDTTQELGEPPPNWCVVPLIALGSWAIGSGFPKNEQGMSVGPYFFLKVSDMNLPGNEKFITTANNCINDDAATRMRVKIHPPGTIIFPKIGGAIATNKRRLLTKSAAIDNNCLGITFSSHLDVEWAFLLLTTIDFTKYQAGTAVPALQQGTLESIPVGLPPLAEQHRIVAKVDELMALCDRLETARTEREATRDRLAAASLIRLHAPDPDPVVFRTHAAFALENLTPLTTRPDQIKALRQTILNLAVRGKLVEQDPNDEPASESLKRIAVEKARRAKTGEVREKAPILSVRPFESDSPIPAAWASVKLVELSNIVMGQSPSGETYNTDGEGVPLINGPVEFSDGPFGLTVANQYTTAPTKVCDKGDFLMCVRGSTTGRSNIAAFDACIGRGVAAIQPLFGDGFVRLFLWSMRKRIINMGRGVAFPSITRKQLENLIVPLPPLAEQHRIVAKVDELMALCDRLEKKLAGGDDTRRRLLDVLLHEVLVMGSDRKSVA